MGIPASKELPSSEGSHNSQKDGMNNLKIPHNALVFVGDGRRALFLRNEGDAISPSLRTERVFEDDNPLMSRAATGQGV